MPPKTVMSLIYSDWIKRKQAEVLNWQINKPGDDDDGGFQAEKPNNQGGVWTTAEALHVLLKYKILEPSDARIQRAKSWLLRHRNLGGDYGDGWPFINRGNSFVDTTARAMLALSYFAQEPEALEALTKAKDWLLENQNDDYGWGIWKYEDSLVSATSYAVMALKEVNSIFKEEKIDHVIESGVEWLQLAKSERTHLWGFSSNPQETNNASTCQAVFALLQLGSEAKYFNEAIDSIMSEFSQDSGWRTIEESYTLKYFGEGLDQRLPWFNSPLAVSVLVSYARELPKQVDIKDIVESTESLKKYDSLYKSMEVTAISKDGLDIRPWASVECLSALMDAQAYLQEHLDEYVSIMSSKLTIIERAGLLKSPPIVVPIRRQTSVYASGRFWILLLPLVGLGLVGTAYLAETVGIEISLIVALFSIYMVTFGVLFLGFRQKIVSRSRFCYLYFPIWALIVLGTCLLYIGQTIEALIVMLLIGFPEILSHVMNKSKGE
jgi:hypothetical protein